MYSPTVSENHHRPQQLWIASHIPHVHQTLRNSTVRDFSSESRPQALSWCHAGRWHTGCYLPPRSPTMTALTNPLFWNMKIKITILTLATFAALC
jgi:hypothetical protein